MSLSEVINTVGQIAEMVNLLITILRTVTGPLPVHMKLVVTTVVAVLVVMRNYLSSIGQLIGSKDAILELAEPIEAACVAMSILSPEPPVTPDEIPPRLRGRR